LPRKLGKKGRKTIAKKKDIASNGNTGWFV
jgi:hypothetical protein